MIRADLTRSAEGLTLSPPKVQWDTATPVGFAGCSGGTPDCRREKAVGGIPWGHEGNEEGRRRSDQNGDPFTCPLPAHNMNKISFGNFNF